MGIIGTLLESKLSKKAVERMLAGITLGMIHGVERGEIDQACLLEDVYNPDSVAVARKALLGLDLIEMFETASKIKGMNAEDLPVTYERIKDLAHIILNQE